MIPKPATRQLTLAFVCSFALFCLAVLADRIHSSPDDPDAPIVIKVQTSTRTSGYSFGYLQEEWAPRLKEMTAGRVSIEFLPINAVMPRNETPEGVAAGVLGGDLTSVSYFSGREPAFAILGDLIAAYETPLQTQAFCRDGGGQQVLQSLWDTKLPGKLTVVGCGGVSREALVSTVPIRGVADLQGLKIRSPEGLAATVFEAAGASPTNIPFSEVFTSLEQGVVDAADASSYVNNDQNGFHQIATYPVYPGFHSIPMHQFTVRTDLWERIAEADRKALVEWYYLAYEDLARALHEQDERLVTRDRGRQDFEVIDWSKDDRKAFRAIAKEHWDRTAARSADARRALDAQIAYLAATGLIDDD